MRQPPSSRMRPLPGCLVRSSGKIHDLSTVEYLFAHHAEA